MRALISYWLYLFRQFYCAHDAVWFGDHRDREWCADCGQRLTPDREPVGISRTDNV